MTSKKNVQFLHPPSLLFLSVRMGPKMVRPPSSTPGRRNLDYQSSPPTHTHTHTVPSLEFFAKNWNAKKNTKMMSEA